MGHPKSVPGQSNNRLTLCGMSKLLDRISYSHNHAFIQDIKLQNQRVTYCGVNAHFQDGVAEKCIRDLQDLTCTTMLHASAYWPKAFLDHLWPYALRCVNETFISAPKRLDGKSVL